MGGFRPHKLGQMTRENPSESENNAMYILLNLVSCDFRGDPFLLRCYYFTIPFYFRAHGFEE